MPGLGARDKAKRAAEVLVKQGLIPEAATALVAGGQHLPAAQLLYSYGDLAGAAEAYEGAGMFQEAERLFRQTGNDDGLLRAAISLRSPSRAP
jgi:hypothetical protein